MSLIQNERSKLLANALDRTSTAYLTVGLLAPLAAVIYGVNGTAMELWRFGLSGVLWFFAAGTLHVGAQLILGGLKA